MHGSDILSGRKDVRVIPATVSLSFNMTEAVWCNKSVHLTTNPFLKTASESAELKHVRHSISHTDIHRQPADRAVKAMHSAMMCGFTQERRAV